MMMILFIAIKENSISSKGSVCTWAVEQEEWVNQNKANWLQRLNKNIQKYNTFQGSFFELNQLTAST